MPILWTDRFKICELSDVPWKTILPSWKTNRSISFIKVSVDNAITCQILRTIWWLRVVPGNANLIRKCEYLNVRKNCLLFQIRFFQNNHLNVFHPDLSQQVFKCGETFKNIISKNVLTSENFSTEMNSFCKAFWFFPRVKSFLLRNHWLHFKNLGISRFFCYSWKSSEVTGLLSKHLFFCNGNLISHNSQKLRNGPIWLDKQSPLPSIQLWVLVLSSSQSADLLLHKMIQYACSFYQTVSRTWWA